MTALTIGTSEIRQIDGLYSLNDLHKASGGAEKHRPAFFLRLDQTQALIAEINCADLHSLETREGRNGGTYACKELVIAYAAWISPAFHLKVIRVFLAQVGRTLLAPETITKAQQGELATLIAERFPSGKDRPYAWSRFNNHFRLASYKDLPANRFQEACQYIRTMQLPHALPSPSSSMKPVVWTHPDGYVGPKWEDRGIPRDDRAIKQIIFELTQWGRENLPKGEVANSFEDAMNDLRQLQITCWTHIDEALSGISRAAYMLHRWQARNGRIGNVS